MKKQWKLSRLDLPEICFVVFQFVCQIFVHQYLVVELIIARALQWFIDESLYTCGVILLCQNFLILKHNILRQNFESHTCSDETHTSAIFSLLTFVCMRVCMQGCVCVWVPLTFLQRCPVFTGCQHSLCPRPSVSATSQSSNQSSAVPLTPARMHIRTCTAHTPPVYTLLTHTSARRGAHTRMQSQTQTQSSVVPLARDKVLCFPLSLGSSWLARGIIKALQWMQKHTHPSTRPHFLTRTCTHTHVCRSCTKHAGGVQVACCYL